MTDMTITGAASINEYFVIIIATAVLFLFACVGISLYITYRILKKYTDFGETECSIHQYSADGVRFKVNKDNVLPVEKEDFFLIYGENPYENIERSIPEQLIRNSGKKDEHK